MIFRTIMVHLFIFLLFLFKILFKLQLFTVQIYISFLSSDINIYKRKINKNKIGYVEVYILYACKILVIKKLLSFIKCYFTLCFIPKPGNLFLCFVKKVKVNLHDYSFIYRNKMIINVPFFSTFLSFTIIIIELFIYY